MAPPLVADGRWQLVNLELISLDLMVLSKGILNTGAIILINSWEEEITLQ
jgi:hypothetical protein